MLRRPIIEYYNTIQYYNIIHNIKNDKILPLISKILDKDSTSFSVDITEYLNDLLRDEKIFIISNIIADFPIKDWVGSVNDDDGRTIIIFSSRSNNDDKVTHDFHHKYKLNEYDSVDVDIKETDEKVTVKLHCEGYNGKELFRDYDMEFLKKGV